MKKKLKTLQNVFSKMATILDSSVNLKLPNLSNTRALQGQNAFSSEACEQTLRQADSEMGEKIK